MPSSSTPALALETKLTLGGSLFSTRYIVLTPSAETCIGKMYPGGRNHSGDLHRLHASHCIYLILQNIMCNANIDIYTHQWNDGVPSPFADFNIDHQCRDFDAILQWQEENSVDQHRFVDLRRPQDAVEHKMSHDFR
jgi:hypothetical protein